LIEVAPLGHFGVTRHNPFQRIVQPVKAWLFDVARLFCCCCVPDVDVELLRNERRLFNDVDRALAMEERYRSTVYDRWPIPPTLGATVDVVSVAARVDNLVVQLGLLDDTRDNRLVVSSELRRVYRTESRPSNAVELPFVVEAYFRCRSRALIAGAYRRRNNRVAAWLGFDPGESYAC